MLGAAAGILFGVSDIAIKAVTGLVGSRRHDRPSSRPWMLVIVAASIAAFYASARGLQDGEAVPVITVTGDRGERDRHRRRHPRLRRPARRATPSASSCRSLAFVLVCVAACADARAAARGAADGRPDVDSRRSADEAVLRRAFELASAHLQGLPDRHVGATADAAQLREALGG